MPAFATMEALRKAVDGGDVVIESDESMALNLGNQAQPRQPEVQIIRSGGSHIEEAFAAMWELLNGPELEREYKFDMSRNWRADFAHPASRVLIEVEGGMWKRDRDGKVRGGRHNRPQGYQKDCEKYNAATGAGWRVFRFTAAMIQPPALDWLIEFIGDHN